MHIIENGNVAAALGVKLCHANVIAAYHALRAGGFEVVDGNHGFMRR